MAEMAPRWPQGAILGASWGRLGASWGHLGGVLGASWSVLGRLGSVLGASWSVLGRLGDGALIGKRAPKKGDQTNKIWPTNVGLISEEKQQKRKLILGTGRLSNQGPLVGGVSDSGSCPGEGD